MDKFTVGLEGGPSLTSLRGNDILKEYSDPKIGFSGGFTIKYNLSKLFSIKTNITEAFNEFPRRSFDDTDNYERFDVGLVTGFGTQIPIKEKLLLTFEIRNNLGLYNTSEVPVSNDGTIKTNSTNLLIGFAYRIGTRDKE